MLNTHYFFENIPIFTFPLFSRLKFSDTLIYYLLELDGSLSLLLFLNINRLLVELIGFIFSNLLPNFYFFYDPDLNFMCLLSLKSSFNRYFDSTELLKSSIKDFLSSSIYIFLISYAFVSILFDFLDFQSSESIWLSYWIILWRRILYSEFFSFD